MAASNSVAWEPCTHHAKTGRVAGSNETLTGEASLSCEWCMRGTITALLVGQRIMAELIDKLATIVSVNIAAPVNKVAGDQIREAIRPLKEQP